MITDLWVQTFGVRSEKGYEKSYILVRNRVRVLRTVRHTPTQNFEEYPPGVNIRGKKRIFALSVVFVVYWRFGLLRLFRSLEISFLGREIGKEKEAQIANKRQRTTDGAKVCLFPFMLTY